MNREYPKDVNRKIFPAMPLCSVHNQVNLMVFDEPKPLVRWDFQMTGTEPARTAKTDVIVNGLTVNPEFASPDGNHLSLAAIEIV